MRNRVLSMLGIAAKSGNVVSGEFSTEKAVKSYRAYLVIVSEEASENTRKKFTNMTDFYQGAMYVFGTKDELGSCSGKEFRADENNAKAVMQKLSDYKTE